MIRSNCDQCREVIEFEEQYVGGTSPCPFCGKTTKLLKPDPWWKSGFILGAGSVGCVGLILIILGIIIAPFFLIAWFDTVTGLPISKIIFSIPVSLTMALLCSAPVCGAAEWLHSRPKPWRYFSFALGLIAIAAFGGGWMLGYRMQQWLYINTLGRLFN